MAKGAVIGYFYLAERPKLGDFTKMFKDIQNLSPSVFFKFGEDINNEMDFYNGKKTWNDLPIILYGSDHFEVEINIENLEYYDNDDLILPIVSHGKQQLEYQLHSWNTHGVDRLLEKERDFYDFFISTIQCIAKYNNPFLGIFGHELTFDLKNPFFIPIKNKNLISEGFVCIELREKFLEYDYIISDEANIIKTEVNNYRLLNKGQEFSLYIGNENIIINEEINQERINEFEYLQYLLKGLKKYIYIDIKLYSDIGKQSIKKCYNTIIPIDSEGFFLFNKTQWDGDEEERRRIYLTEMYPIIIQLLSS